MRDYSWPDNLSFNQPRDRLEHFETYKHGYGRWEGMNCGTQTLNIELCSGSLNDQTDRITLVDRNRTTQSKNENIRDKVPILKTRNSYIS